MAAVVDSFEFKRLVLKSTPRAADAQESKENSFWKKFKVSLYRRRILGPVFTLTLYARTYV